MSLVHVIVPSFARSASSRFLCTTSDRLIVALDLLATATVAAQGSDQSAPYWLALFQLDVHSDPLTNSHVLALVHDQLATISTIVGSAGWIEVHASELGLGPWVGVPLDPSGSAFIFLTGGKPIRRRFHDGKYVGLLFGHLQVINLTLLMQWPLNFMIIRAHT